MSIDEATWELSPEISPRYAGSLQAQVLSNLCAQTRSILLKHGSESATGDAPAALGALLALSEQRRSRIMMHPSFRYWLQAMRRTSGVNELSSFRQDLLDRATDFVWAESRGAGGRPWRVKTDDRGGLRCAVGGRFIELGTGYADHVVDATPGADEVTLQCRDGLTIKLPYSDLEGPPEQPLPTIEDHGYALSISPSLSGGQIEVSSRDPWLRVELTGNNQRTDGVSYFGAIDAYYDERPNLQTLDEAFRALKRTWNEAYEDFAEFTRVIVPIDSAAALSAGAVKRNQPQEQTGVHFAFTISSRQGAIYIGEAPVDATIEMLLHENAHVKLRQIQSVDPIIVDPLDDNIRVAVPWRPDPRPIPGILEGLFVFSHVQEFELRRYLVNPEEVDKKRLSSRMQDLYYAANVLSEKASFTARGTIFMARMNAWLGDMRSRI